MCDIYNVTNFLRRKSKREKNIFLHVCHLEACVLGMGIWHVLFKPKVVVKLKESIMITKMEALFAELKKKSKLSQWYTYAYIWYSHSMKTVIKLNFKQTRISTLKRSYVFKVQKIKNTFIKKQAQRRAAAETAFRELIEHFILLMHNSSRHLNCWIYHDFELMCLTRKNN